MAGQHQGAFDGLWHHFGGAGLLQLLQVMVVLRAHDHRHMRRMGAGVRHDLEGAGHVQVGDDHRAGTGQAGRHQRLQPGGVAEHHRVAGGSGLAHAVRVQVQRHVGDTFTLQHARQVLAAAAIAADDDVAVGVDRLAGDGGHLQRLLQPLGGHQLHHDAVAEHDDEGRGQHRQHHGREDGVHQRRRHQALRLRQRQQHETELPGLGQVQPGAQRHPHGGAQPARQQGDQRQLEQQGQHQQRQHQRPALQHDVPVQHHADGDEEQAQQHVVERPDVGLHLVFVFGLRHQHAGDEGTERQAQPRQLGKPGQAQRDQQQVEHEQLFAAPPRHQREPPAHHPLAAHQQQGDEYGGLEHGKTHGFQQLVGRGAQRRDQHQQRHHGQVLEQQDAHHPLAVFTLQLQPLGHELHHDGGAAHRQGPRQRHGGLPAHLPVRGEQGGQQQRSADGHHHGHQHLQQAQPEHMAAHRAQLGQTEFQPDGEHQEHHPKLTQVAHPGRVLRQRQRVRADQHPGGQVAQHGRQLEAAADHHPQHGSQQIQEGESKRGHPPMLAREVPVPPGGLHGGVDRIHG